VSLCRIGKSRSVQEYCHPHCIVVSLCAAMSGRRHTARGGAPRPVMYTHQPDRASVVRVSNDGRRILDRPVPVNPVLAATPSYFEEDATTNAALDAPDFSYDLGDDSLAQEEQGPELDGISVQVKAKRYANSVCFLLSIKLKKCTEMRFFFRTCPSRPGLATVTNTWMRCCASKAGVTSKFILLAAHAAPQTPPTGASIKHATVRACSASSASWSGTQSSPPTGSRYVTMCCRDRDVG
jgi:hypothetical protein